MVQLRQRVLGRRRAGVGEQRLVQREQALVERARGLVVAGGRRCVELGAELRGDVGGDRDAADLPERIAGERERVVARELAEVRSGADAMLHSAFQLAARVLDADDPGRKTTNEFDYRL